MSSNDIALVIDGVQLREVGGEGTTVLEKAPSRLVVHGGSSPTLEVGATKVKITKKSYQKVGDREYKFATDDVMTFLYLELPKGLPEAQYAAVAAVFEALAEGKPLPTSAVDGSAAAATAATAAAPDAPAVAAAPGGRGAAPGAGIGAFFGALAAKAVHDTKAVGAAIREKAEHDYKLMNEQQAAANAAALKREAEEKAAKAGAGGAAPAPA
jgi:hypothetical protein